MARLFFDDCVLLDPEAREPAPGQLLVEDGRIAARLRPQAPAPEGAERVSLGGHALAPGLVDVHFHGATIFHDADSIHDALRVDSQRLARSGVTAFLTTTVTRPREDLASCVMAVAESLARADWPGARAVGIHLEGPWIQPAAAGAQPRPAIRRYDAGEGKALLDAAGGRVRMVTLAPEVAGAAELQAELERRGVIAALGHSHATLDAVDDAVRRGARHVTHLFNAMGPLHQRAPGLAGAALADDRLTCDLICDGVHVDPALVRVAARAKGERLILVTDRLDPPDGALDFGSGPVHDDGAALRLADGTLAGSRLRLDRAVANARRYAGMTQLEAVAAASLRPVRLLGLESELGSLRPGARADLVVLDADDRVQSTWVGGRRVYRV